MRAYRRVKRVTISSSGGRGRSSGGPLGRPMWTKPAMRSLSLNAERVEHAAVVGVPFGDPVGRVAERVGREHEAHGGGAGGQHLLPFRNLHVRRGSAHHRDDQRRAGKRVRSFDLDLLGLGQSGTWPRNPAAIASPAASRASPSKTMKRQGMSLPWSGTREATVSSVSISAAVGAGPASSTGLTRTAGLEQFERVGHRHGGSGAQLWGSWAARSIRREG